MLHLNFPPIKLVFVGLHKNNVESNYVYQRELQLCLYSLGAIINYLLKLLPS